MSRKLNVATDPRLAAPEVRLTRIAHIPTIEIMASELQTIEDAATEEKTALAFWTAGVGALLSSLLAIPAADASAVRWAVFTSITAVVAVLTLWFLLAWLRKRKRCARILSEIRARVPTVQHTTLLPAPHANNVAEPDEPSA